MGESSPPRASATAIDNAGGRLRLTARWIGRPSVAGGTVGGTPVSSVRPTPGRATAPITGTQPAQRLHQELVGLEVAGVLDLALGRGLRGHGPAQIEEEVTRLLRQRPGDLVVGATPAAVGRSARCTIGRRREEETG